MNGMDIGCMCSTFCLIYLGLGIYGALTRLFSPDLGLGTECAQSWEYKCISRRSAKLLQMCQKCLLT